MKFHPTPGRVLIRRDPIPERSRGGIALMKSTQEEKAHLYLGTVLAVGNPKQLKNGKTRMPICREKDRVLFIAPCGWDAEKAPHLGKEAESLVFLNDDDIIAVVDESKQKI